MIIILHDDWYLFFSLFFPFIDSISLSLSAGDDSLEHTLHSSSVIIRRQLLSMAARKLVSQSSKQSCKKAVFLRKISVGVANEHRYMYV